MPIRDYIRNILSKIGLSKEERPHELLWCLRQSGMFGANNLHVDKTCQWSIERIEISEKREVLALKNLSVKLLQDEFLASLDRSIKLYFGKKVRSEFIRNPSGVIAAFFEGHFKFKKSKELGEEKSPLAAFGFKIVFSVEGSKINVNIYDHFVLGDLPIDICRMSSKAIINSLGIKLSDFHQLKSQKEGTSFRNIIEINSIHEFRFSLFLPFILSKKNLISQEDALLLLSEVMAIKNAAFACHYENGAYHFVLTSKVNTAGVGDIKTADIPLEILESREKPLEILALDRLLLNGKYEKYLEESGCIGYAQSDPFYKKRLAIVLLFGKLPLNKEAVLGAFRDECEDLLVNSAAVRCFLDMGEKHKALICLSKLGQILSKKIDNLESVRSLEVVFSELLGDLWMFEDPHRAFSAFDRIIKKRGAHPRILKKMAASADLQQNVQIKYNCLKMLIEVERRYFLLAEAFFEVAATLKSYPELGRAYGENPIDYGMKALSLRKGNLKYLFMSVELLTANGSFREAILILDQTLRDPEVRLTPVDRAKLEHAIGDIWKNGLGRSDLAKSRYEQSYLHLGTNILLMQSLAQIYRTNGDDKKLAPLLEVILNQELYEHKVREVISTATELLDIYVNRSRDDIAAFKILTKLKHDPMLVLGELEKIKLGIVSDYVASMAKEDKSLVSVFCHNVYESLKSDPGSSIRRSLHLILAEIARKHLYEEDFAVNLLLEIFEPNSSGGDFDADLDEESESFLIAYLEDKRLYAKLAGYFESAVKISMEYSRRTNLMIRIYNLPEGVSRERKDQILLECIESEETHKYCDIYALLDKRVQEEVKLGKVLHLERLIGQIIKSESVERHIKKKILYATIDILIDSGLKIYSSIIKIIMDEIMENEEREVYLNRVIDYFSKVRSHKDLEYYVRLMIDAEYIPNMSKEDVISYLENEPIYICAFYILLANKEPSRELQQYYAGQALEVVHIRKLKSVKNLGSVLIIHGSHQRLKATEMEFLEDICAKTGEYQKYLETLGFQLELEKDPNKKLEILNKISKIQLTSLHDPDAAMRTLKVALEIEMDPSRTLGKLADIARTKGDFKLEGDYLYRILSERRMMSNSEGLGRIYGRLVELNYQMNNSTEVLKDYVEKLVQSRLGLEALKISDIIVNHGHADAALHKLRFMAALELQDSERVAQTWVDNCIFLGEDPICKKFFEFSIDAMFSRKMKATVTLCYQLLINLFSETKISLNKDVYFEVVLNYATLLFHDNIHRERALALFDKAFELRPFDSRIWIPHYMLLSEFGSDQRRIEQLRAILPLIEENRNQIAKYPVTLESLKVQLSKLERNGLTIQEQSNLIQERSAVGSENTQNISLQNSVSNFVAYTSGTGAIAPINTDSQQDGIGDEGPGQKSKSERGHLSLVSNPDASDSKVENDKSNYLESISEIEVISLNSNQGAQTSVIDNVVPPPPITQVEIREKMFTGHTEEVQNSLAKINQDAKNVLGSINWKEKLKHREFQGNELSHTPDEVFKSELERHIGQQVLGLLSGEMKELMIRSKAKVWRNFNDVFYDHLVQKRVPPEIASFRTERLTSLKSELFGLIQYISPVLVRAYEERFSINYLGRVAKLKTSDIKKSASRLELNHPLIRKSGLIKYKERLKEKSLTLWSIKGLNQHIFYEGREKAVYLDAAFYQELPVSFFIHRVTELLIEIRLNYFVPLALDPISHVEPIIRYIFQKTNVQNEYIKDKSIALDQSVLADSIRRLDKHRLIEFAKKAGNYEARNLMELWHSMRTHVKLLDLAETLDFVGHFESRLGRDLLEKPPRPGEILSLVKDADYYLDFATMLIV